MTNRFDTLAQQWDSKPQRVESAMKFVDYIKSNINRDIASFNILDYGSGSGLVSFGFAEDVSSITGLDYSIGMVDRYNQKAKILEFNHLNAKQHNINEEDLEHNQYDLVVTNMTMHHIKDISNFIKILKNSLTKGGSLYISDLITEDGKFHSKGNDGVEHLGFDEETLYEEFIKYGFKNIEFKILQTIKKEQGNYPIFVISGVSV
ncbi:MAG: class I SAM-dependent methyltransferase [Campylobacterota bacterium]|nr:class I SAM-dependent methyltransferase [Campylobacterota bacterium]